MNFLYFLIIYIIYFSNKICNVHGASSVCPLFKVEYDKETSAMFVIARNYNVLTTEKIWGDEELTMRVPLDNFKVTYPACFTDNLVVVEAPLVSSTLTATTTATTTTASTKSISASSSTSSSSDNIIKLPFARNPPPGYDYCTIEIALFSIGDITYCNDYSQFVMAERGSSLSPSDPNCFPPYCYPCASDPTGLGVVATMGVSGQQQYCSEDGVCATLYVCIPIIGCGSFDDCKCEQASCLQNKWRPQAIGPSASKGLKQWYYLSDKNQPIFNGTYAIGQSYHSCCSYQTNRNVCEFQQTSCKCYAAFSPVYSISNNQKQIFSFKGERVEGQTIRKKLDSYNGNYNEKKGVYLVDPQKSKCCSNSILKPDLKTPVIFFDDRKDVSLLEYTIADVCPPTTGVTFKFMSPKPLSKYVATTSIGQQNPTDNIVLASSVNNKTTCLRVWSKINYEGVSAYFCNDATDGQDGVFSFLGLVYMHSDTSPDQWWTKPLDDKNSKGWDKEIKSWSIPSHSKVVFYQEKNFDVSSTNAKKSSTLTNCDCPDYKSKSNCCLQGDWGISSMIICLQKSITC